MKCHFFNWICEDDGDQEEFDEKDLELIKELIEESENFQRNLESHL